MAKRVEVKTELTAEELHERYRQASEPVERTHWHILWLMKEGHTPREVAQRVGYTARWVRTIVERAKSGELDASPAWPSGGRSPGLGLSAALRLQCACPPSQACSG